MGQVVSQSELILRRGLWKSDGRVVVCVNGSFDLLHPGHVRLLEQARSLGDILVVAVRSDASVRALSTSGWVARAQSVARPVTPAAERMEIVAALAAVEYVVEFEDQTWPEFCARLSPDLIVRGAGADTSPSGADQASRVAHGKVINLPLEPGYSTAQLIERIKQPTP